MKHRILLPLLSLVLGCGAGQSAPIVDAAPPPDVASLDTSAGLDVGLDAPSAADVAALDTAAEASTDASITNGSDEILGTLRGTCGTLRAALRSPLPSLIENDLTFMAPERYERASLSPGGQRLFDTPNAGGSSTESEALSYEVLHFCEGASLRATETEIRYAPPDDSGPNTISDILVEIDGLRVGVSVTRAYRPAPMVLADADVRELLTRKLEGINRSSLRVLPGDRWVKQILHVFVPNAAVAAQVRRTWEVLAPAVRADTIVELTTTRGGGFLYCDPDPALGSECPSLR